MTPSDFSSTPRWFQSSGQPPQHDLQYIGSVHKDKDLFMLRYKKKLLLCEFRLHRLILIVSHDGGLSRNRAPCLDSCHWDTKQSSHTNDLTWIRLYKYICRKFTARKQLVGFKRLSYSEIV